MFSIAAHPSYLRYVLLGDALASGATGLLLALGASVLPPWLGLPETLLREAGLILLPYAAFVAWLSGRCTHGLVVTAIVINLLWSIDSLVLLIGPWFAPTALGIAFVAVQALVVLGFAVAQYLGLRARSLGPAFA